MNRDEIRDLESVIEAALTTLFATGRGPRSADGAAMWHGRPPAPHTLHLMAKAAVTVLEATEEQPPEPRRR